MSLSSGAYFRSKSLILNFPCVELFFSCKEAQYVQLAVRRPKTYWARKMRRMATSVTIKVNPSVKTLHFEYILHGDALGKGMYLGMLRNDATTLVRKPFSENDTAKSSTFREVKVFWTLYED